MIGTKLDARSRRNELTEVTERWIGRWQKVTECSDQEGQQTGISSSDRMLVESNRTLQSRGSATVGVTGRW